MSTARERTRRGWRCCAPAIVAAGLLVILALSGCGSSAGASQPTGSVQGAGLQGLILKPAKPAAPLTLRNYTARGALGRMDHLLGSRAQLLRTWKAWDVGVNVNGKQLTVGHTAIVYGVSASGHLAVVYPSDFSPPQIVHDVPLLARM